MSKLAEFEALIAEAERQPFHGWDFSYLDGRMVEASLSFDYVAEVRKKLKGVASMLDLGTGGGEVLSQIVPFPRTTIATEAYAPNAYVAARKLAQINASVVLIEGAPENWTTLSTPDRNTPALALRDRAFDIVINRHESYLAAEVFRVLRPGGRFITQQCGGVNHLELNDLLGIPRPQYESWCLDKADAQLRAVRFDFVAGREDFTTTLFHDVGAIVYYLRALPWQAPDFAAADHLESLRALYRHIETNGPLKIRSHHFLVEAIKPF